MKEFYKENKINDKTKIWANGYSKWFPLGEVPQFKWSVCQEVTPSGDGDSSTSNQSAAAMLYSLTELCVVILDILIQMCSFFPSRDEAGAVIRPLPKVKKVLSDPNLLYLIVPLILTNDASIVQRVAHLLLQVMEVSPFSTPLKHYWHYSLLIF